MGASPNTTGVLKRMANMDTEKHRGGRWPSEDEGRDWGDASTRPGTSKMASKILNAGREAWNAFSLSAHGRNQPCPHHDFRLPVSRTERQPISVVYSLWGFVMIAQKTNTTLLYG